YLPLASRFTTLQISNFTTLQTNIPPRNDGLIACHHTYASNRSRNGRGIQTKNSCPANRTAIYIHETENYPLSGRGVNRAPPSASVVSGISGASRPSWLASTLTSVR